MGYIAIEHNLPLLGYIRFGLAENTSVGRNIECHTTFLIYLDMTFVAG
jgi:hypothetical protein